MNSGRVSVYVCVCIGGGYWVGVSYSHTVKEKPRLQIQEDQVLSLLFYEEAKAAGAQEPLRSPPAQTFPLGETHWPLLVGLKTLTSSVL